MHIGWDWWRGNTTVVSHDAGGKKDAYRAIYMHFQNDPYNDCNNAWTKTIPNFNAADQATYLTYSENTGYFIDPYGIYFYPDVSPESPQLILAIESTLNEINT